MLMNYAPPSIAGLRLGVRRPNAPLPYVCPPRGRVGGKGLLIFLYSSSPDGTVLAYTPERGWGKSLPRREVEVGVSRRRRIRERPKSNGHAANECRLTTSLRSMLHGKQDSPGVCWSPRARDLGLPVALPGAAGQPGCRTDRSLHHQARERGRGA